MFGHGLFPDSVLATAEQDITKYQFAGAAPGPGPGASQCSSWRGNYRFKLYEKRESHQSSDHSDQGQQPWRQFSRNRNRGRRRGSNPRFSKARGNKSFNDNYCSVPTQLNPPLSRLDNKLSQWDQTINFLVVKQRPAQRLSDSMFKKAVFYQNVFGHAHSVTLHGQPQRKGLGPDLSLSKIKIVKSVSCLFFCPICSKCPTCCHRDQCWGKASELLASLAKVGLKSQSSFSFERRLQSSF